MSVSLKNGKVLIGNLVRVTAQRAFAEDWQNNTDRPPQSYRRLPIVYRGGKSGENELAAALCPGEVVWLGFELVNPNRPVQITATFLINPVGRPHLVLQCPPDYALKGVPKDHGWRPFGANADRLHLEFRLLKPRVAGKSGGGTKITLSFLPVDEVFSPGDRRSIGPLNRDDGYAGYRLP
jgi:hypothetical protein